MDSAATVGAGLTRSMLACWFVGSWWDVLRRDWYLVSMLMEKGGTY